jgi:hypothetical protein
MLGKGDRKKWSSEEALKEHHEKLDKERKLNSSLQRWDLLKRFAAVSAHCLSF